MSPVLANCIDVIVCVCAQWSALSSHGNIMEYTYDVPSWVDHGVSVDREVVGQVFRQSANRWTGENKSALEKHLSPL